jgi:hypothetical protein
MLVEHLWRCDILSWTTRFILSLGNLGSKQNTQKSSYTT